MTPAVLDALAHAEHEARRSHDRFSLVGWGVAILGDEDGVPLEVFPFTNLITDVGDLYYATRAIAAVSPAAAADATKATGMQIGTNVTTAPAKSSTGASLAGTLLSGQAFDATFPKTVNLGAGLGVNAQYQTTWAAGTGTGTVGEVVLTNTATLGTAAAAGATIARAQINAGSGTVKGAGQPLTVVWNQTFLGS